MSIQNNSRTSDLGTILTDGATGFVARKRTGIGLIFHLFLFACTLLLGLALLFYYESARGCLLAIAICLSLGIIAENTQRLKRTKESIEFINALFSSALGSGYKFCFIVKSSGDIVFYNRPFQTVFPAYIEQENRTLDGLLNLYNAPKADKDILKGFVFSNSGGNIRITVKTTRATESETYAFHVEPIERPTGFFLVRGK